MATTQKIQIVNHNQQSNTTYGTMNVPEPKNFTRNGAYISQYKYNMQDLNETVYSAQKFFSLDKHNGGFAAQLLSCVEIDWGNAKEGWKLTDDPIHKDNQDWNDGKHDFPEAIKTSADLLQYIFMLRWKLEHISTTPATYTLLLNPQTLKVTYQKTGTITAKTSQSNTDAKVTSYLWSLASTKDFEIPQNENTSETVTISHKATLNSSYELPTPTAAVTQQMDSATGTAKVQCTPGSATEIAPTSSKTTATCTIKWSDGHTESSTSNIESDGYQSSTAPTITSYSWTVTSNASYVTLKDGDKAVCTLEGKNTTSSNVTVKVKCTVTWSSDSKETTELSVVIPGVEQNYYWYIGATNPTSVSLVLTDTTKAGWHQIGTSSNGFNLIFNNQNKIEFENKTQYYVIIPNDLHLYAADGNTLLEGRSFNSVSCNIENHKAFQYYVSAFEVKGLVIK